MTNYSKLLTLLFVLAPVLRGEPIYVLRVGPTYSQYQQGIIRFDPESRVETPFADFIYSSYFDGVMGGLHLTGLSDRIVAQGAAYYEFDAGSGQLLRRYAALPGAFDTWAFHATVVEPAAAKLIGVPSGYYGEPICPDSSGSPGIGCSLPEIPFPGYTVSRTNITDQHVFLHRGFDPRDTELTVAKIFPTGSGGDSLWERRLPAVDIEGRRFWFRFLASREVRSASIINASITDDVIVMKDETPGALLAFSFDEPRRAFSLIYNYNYQTRLVTRSLGGSEAATLKTSSGDEKFDSVTSLSPVEPDTYTQLLPAVADAPGLNGTYWRSDAWLFNPSGEAMDVTLHRVSTPAVSKSIALAARQSVKIANVLQDLGGSGLDAVVIDSPYRKNAQLSVYSRTYTTSADGGTYGQAIPAVPSEVGYTNHLAPTTRANSIAETYSLFILDKRNPQQFRHNIGVVNASDNAMTLRLRYAIVSGLPVRDPRREKFLTIPPHTVHQFPVELLFPESVDTLPAYIWVTADKPAALWMSMVDNKSGDASFVPFTFYDIEAGPDSRLAVPSIAHATDASGRSWKTDAYGVFWARATKRDPQTPDVNFHGTADRCDDASITRQLKATPSVQNGQDAEPVPFWFTTFADIGKQVCPNSEQTRGALEVRTGSWMSMVTRTFTTRPDGGTYGEMLPLYPPRGWPVRHFAGLDVNAQSQISIGLYNGLDGPSTIALRLYDSSGQLAAEASVTLPAKQSVDQTLAETFGSSPQPGVYGLSVLPQNGAGCWPYVSTVDNKTGDPTIWW